jgi:hypothetical protein
VTEPEWQECADPERMLAYLEGSASERVLWLLYCACSRRVWHLLETADLRQAVEAFERFADGEIDEESFRPSATTTHPLMNYRDEMFSGQTREEVISAAYGVNLAVNAAMNVPGYEGYSYRKALEFFAYAARPGDDRERAAHTDLIRDLFGSPFRSSVVQPAWLCWGEGIIVKLAAAIYDERSLPTGTLDGMRLRVLADALEEAGCSDADILGHLRSPGPHVRGCWALDLVLGKG